MRVELSLDIHPEGKSFSRMLGMRDEEALTCLLLVNKMLNDMEEHTESHDLGFALDWYARKHEECEISDAQFITCLVTSVMAQKQMQEDGRAGSE